MPANDTSSIKRILILTADAGFGHRSAANALEEALRELYGETCMVSIVNPLEDKRVLPFLRDSQSDYDRIIREMPQLYKLGYEASDAAVPGTLVESALTLMLFEVMYDLVRHHRPDAIVTTFPLYQAPLVAVYAVRRHYIPLITVITDLVTVHRLWFNTAVDWCLVPTSEVEKLALDHGVPPERVKITGIPVRPALAYMSPDRAAIRAELGWQDRTTLLVVGSRRVERLPEVLRAINHSKLPVQLAIVAGGDAELYEELNNNHWHLPTHIYSFVKNMPQLMQAADCLISKAGGLIVTEALAAGLPLLLVDALPGQEIGNADYVVRGGAGELVPDPIGVLETLYHWLDQDGAMLARRARAARQLGRPRAACEIAELVWSAAHQEPRSRRRSRDRAVSLTEWLRLDRALRHRTESERRALSRSASRFSATAIAYWHKGPGWVLRQFTDLELAQRVSKVRLIRRKEESDQ